MLTDDDKLTQFDYLLNAYTAAAQADKPSEHGYGDKRRALYAYVRDLERKAAILASSSAAREDAERYRWLRDALPAQIAAINNLEAAEWDTAVDAARSATKGEGAV